MTNLYELEWENIHSHSHYSNIMTPDSVIKTEDLAKRAVAMGQKTISTVEHGYFGSIFDYYETAQEYGLKLIFGIEYYFVKDRFEKDRTNSHLLVVAKNEEGRREMTSIMSEANKTGFFYHPRIDEELLFSLTPENVIVTTACLSSPLNSYSEDEAMRFLSKAKEHFGDNFYIEVQPHTNIKQVEFQKKILKYNRTFGFPLILGVDSHYIKLEDDKIRDLFLKGKNIHYPAEDGFTMDYPSISEIVDRLKLQGVLTDAQIEEAITNTLVARDFEGVSLDKEIKMPSLYPDKSHEEKIKILKGLINEKWEEDRKEIPEEKWGEYIEAIREEVKIIEETKMEDYFLLNHAIVKKAVEEYGGVITSTGRGCFVGTAPIRTKEGIKPIKDVRVGDEVITSDGKWERVYDTFEYDLNKEDLIEIKYQTQGVQKEGYEVIGTLDHEFLVHRDGENEYIPLSDIKEGDYLVSPKSKINEGIRDEVVIDLNDYNIFGYDYDDKYIYEVVNNGTTYDFSPADCEKRGILSVNIAYKLSTNSFNWKKARKTTLEKINKFFSVSPFKTQKEYIKYTDSKKYIKSSIPRYLTLDKEMNQFIGLLYGDGWIRRSDGRDVCLAVNKTSKYKYNRNVFYSVADRLGLETYEKVAKNGKNLIQLYMKSNILKEFIKDFVFIDGKNDNFNFDLVEKQSRDNIEGLFEGLMRSDGSIKGDSGRYAFDSTSPSLLEGFRQASSIIGIEPMSISVRDSHIDSRGYNNKESYKLRWYNNRVNKILEDDENWYLKVTEIKRHENATTKVYDLAVSNNHSFVIGNITVHNSAPSFYVNKLLGLTDIDRVNVPITLYPTRFMSKSRIIETRSLPDIDFNLADPEPFRKASKDLMGDDNSEWMVAYGTMQESSAFKNYARSVGIDYNEANRVSDDLDRYKNDMRWGEIIEASSAFRGVIDSVAPHPCFVGDTLVNTDKGLVEIEKIKVGDMVLTHKNRYKKVTNVMKRESKDLYELKAMGSPYTVVTGSHPYYTRRKSNIGREFSDPTWKSVEELKKGDYLGFAINQKNVIPSNENLPLDNNDFWWIIGRYLGDGWWKNRRPNHNGEYLTIICANKKNSEVEDIKYKLNNLSEYFNYYITEEETVYRVNIQSKFLYEFIKDFGKGAKNKRITGEVMNLPPSLLRSIIDGYISADGSLERDRKVISFTTVSPELAHGMSSIIMKAYKRPVKMYKGIVKDSIIDGRIIKGGTRFVGKFTPIKTKGEQAFYEDGYIWAPFRKKKRVGEKNDVFNLEVESDNSYTANSMIVHNCSHLLLPISNTSETTGTIRVKDEFVTLITSSESDDYKYLKNDLLSVTVVDIIQRVYDMIGKPRHTIRELEELVEGDDKVWKLYRDGIVATLNQTGTKSGKPQVMQYKPTSVAELSMWVASIRPGFASLKQEFFNRKEHKYGIDSLDDVLSETNGYMIFQENIMAVLMYAGISEDRTYSIIKGISKKVPSIVDNAKEEFYSGFLERTSREGYDEEFAKKTADEVWKVMEDASDYSFNASHAYSVALDSVYGAYLKAYYPLEYYTVILNIYQNDSDKIAEIEQELDYFGIKIGPIVFGGSRANYTPDKETNTIFKGIWSIKYMNEKISEELFELSQTEPYLNKEKDALDLFLDLIENTSVNSRQTEILINLDFFAEFGKAEFLLNLWNTMNNKGMPELVDEKYADKKKNPVFYSKNHIDKTKAKRIENLKEYVELLKENPPIERTTYEKIMYEKEFIGHATTTFPELPPSYVLITDLNLKYTPILEVYQLSTGKTFDVKIKKNKFYDTYDNPIVFRGNIIRIIDSHREYGKKLVDGKWYDNKSVTWMFIDKMSIITG